MHIRDITIYYYALLQLVSVCFINCRGVSRIFQRWFLSKFLQCYEYSIRVVEASADCSIRISRSNSLLSNAECKSPIAQSPCPVSIYSACIFTVNLLFLGFPEPQETPLNMPLNRPHFSCTYISLLTFLKTILLTGEPTHPVSKVPRPQLNLLSSKKYIILCLSAIFN